MFLHMNCGVESDWAGEKALTAAWARVRSNGGRAGADGVSVDAFCRTEADGISGLCRDLRSGRYRPFRPFTVRKTKANGSVRHLKIPTVRDRIAQTACATALMAIFEPRFGPSSFAYRPGLSVEHAAARIARLRLQGWTFGFRADIRSFFDEIPHRFLMHLIEGELPCSGTGAVIRLWLKRYSRYGRGVGQGSPISPCLSNIYLMNFDRHVDRGRFRIVRFADDFLVLARCKRDICGVEWVIRENLRDIGLRLNTEKSDIVTFEAGFSFLGMQFMGDHISRSGSKPDAVRAKVV